MAFTDSQKASIRHYMGWPERFADSDSALELAIRAVEGLATEALILTWLSDADTIWSEILSARTRLKAVQVDDVKLPQGMEIAELRNLGRQITGSIAAALAVEVRHDVWGPGGPNYRTSGYGGPGAGGGGLLSYG